MLEGFEEAFVDAQSRVVSLCLELLKNSEKKADKIYIYLFQNDDEDYIDAFFEKEGNLYTTSELFSEEEIDDFFDCGVEDIENIIDICKAYDVKCPHEFRLTYNVISKSFDSNYNYDNVTTESKFFVLYTVPGIKVMSFTSKPLSKASAI